MRFSAIFVAIRAITGVLAAPAAIEPRVANIVTVDSVVDAGQMSAATGDMSAAAAAKPCGGGPSITCWVDIDFNSGAINVMALSDNQVKNDIFGDGVCIRKGFFDFGGVNNWFKCYSDDYAAFLNDGLTVDGGNFMDGGVPRVAYYRVSDNTNYRLNFPPVGPLGKRGFTHFYYDGNGKITRMDSFGNWCVYLFATKST